MVNRWGGRPAARFRALVLARDGYRCLMLRDGVVCGDPATTVQHVVPLADGGPPLDPANAVAACAPCNQREGGRIRQAGHARPAPAQLTARQAELVALLDQLGVPADAGTHHAAGRLAVVVGRADLRAAVAYRRQRGPLTTAPPSRRW